MESRIIFLGSGTGGAVSQQERSSGGIIIQTQGYQFFIDPGVGALAKSRQFGINPRYTTALLVSHAHLHHSNDANAVISSMTHDGLDPKGVLISNKTFVRGNEEINPVLSKFHQKCVERIITPEAGQKIGIENIEVHALKTQHSDPDTVGFKFFTRDFILSYSSDTGYTKEIADQYAQSDILILNVPTNDKEDPFNLNVADAVKIIKRIQPRLAILTHFGIKLVNQDPLVIAREVNKETAIQVVCAKDGLLVSPQSYAAELKQKTLNLYSTEEEQIHIQEHNPDSEKASQDKSDLPFL